MSQKLRQTFHESKLHARVALMLRADSLLKLQSLLPGQNLHELAKKHEITVEVAGKKNKGWVGQTLEKVANLENSNLQKKDGEDFELKSTSLILKDGNWFPKETIKVTMLNPTRMIEETFETSALWNKLSRLILVGCYHENETLCQAITVKGIDITNPELVSPIQQFWEDIQYTLINGELSQYHDIGRSTDLIQLRPTGDGKHFSTCPMTGDKFPARAFYLTKIFISKILFA